tara:strand:- start:240 stop:1082 length:843 start_codon:yes stop_codon:yes gene_type:complete
MNSISFNTFFAASYDSGGGGGGSSLQSGQWYPMFAVKAFQTGSGGIPDADCEIPMRRALQFDTTNTTALTGTESLSTILGILDTSKYTCNAAFKTSTTYISGFQIKHYENATTLHDECETTWNGTGFNIYDHACNAATNLSYALPSQIGTVQTATVNGTDLLSANTQPLMINASTCGSRTGSDNWLSDNGDYCFLGVFDLNALTFGNNSDNLDVYNALDYIAFGISDSDGAPSSSQTPMNGISRRASGYKSLVTNNRERTHYIHSGGSTTGYFLVYGKVI